MFNANRARPPLHFALWATGNLGAARVHSLAPTGFHHGGKHVAFLAERDVGARQVVCREARQVACFFEFGPPLILPVCAILRPQHRRAPALVCNGSLVS